MENVPDFADGNKCGVDVPKGVLGRYVVQSCSTYHEARSNVNVINRITMK